VWLLKDAAEPLGRSRIPANDRRCAAQRPRLKFRAPDPHSRTAARPTMDKALDSASPADEAHPTSANPTFPRERPNDTVKALPGGSSSENFPDWRATPEEAQLCRSCASDAAAVRGKERKRGTAMARRWGDRGRLRKGGLGLGRLAARLVSLVSDRSCPLADDGDREFRRSGPCMRDGALEVGEPKAPVGRERKRPFAPLTLSRRAMPSPAGPPRATDNRGVERGARSATAVTLPDLPRGDLAPTAGFRLSFSLGLERLSEIYSHLRYEINDSIPRSPFYHHPPFLLRFNCLQTTWMKYFSA
jgi:hypothetical protein